MPVGGVARPGILKFGVLSCVILLFMGMIVVRLNPHLISFSEPDVEETDIPSENTNMTSPTEQIDIDTPQTIVDTPQIIIEPPQVVLDADPPLSEFLTGEDPLDTPYGPIEIVKKYCPIGNISQCLTYLQETSPRRLANDNETLIIHTAWRGEIAPLHQFLLYSFLATQNLSRTILIYWIEQSTFNSSMNNPLLEPFLGRSNIVFKCYNVSELAAGTPLDTAVDHGEHNQHIQRLLGVLHGPLAGDLFRMLILYKYGGIYIDVDVMLLRSFEPLMANEFGYTWSGYGGLNTAVFGLKARGHTVESLFDYIITERKPDFHPFKLFDGVNNRTLPLVIYPATFFDPVWILADRFSPMYNYPYSKWKGLFDTANSTKSFWEGAYGNHFHNMYEIKSWAEDSWAGVVEQKWKKEVAKLPRNNKILFWRKEYDELLISKCK